MPEPLPLPGHLPVALPLSRSFSPSSTVGAVGGLGPPLAVFTEIQSLPPRGLSTLPDASTAGCQQDSSAPLLFCPALQVGPAQGTARVGGGEAGALGPGGQGFKRRKGGGRVRRTTLRDPEEQDSGLQTNSLAR